MASIRERTTNGGETTYQVLYRHGGKQASQTFTARRGRPDDGIYGAEDFKALVDLLGPDRALKEIDASSDDRLTVADLAERFLEWKARDVEPRTLGEYRRDIDNWIIPWFGHRAAETIDEADVQRWVDHMAAKLSPKSVAGRHMLLHSMYAFGKKRSRGLVSHNPCEETDLPAASQKRAKGTTVPQWRSIMAAAHERNPDAEDLIRFLGTVGWRFSEAIALPVANVDDRGDGTLWVDMTQVFRVVNNRQVLVTDAAKSYAGFRNVRVLSVDTAAMLRRRVVGKAPHDLVFTNSGGRHWNQQTFLRETWPAILTDVGLWRGPRSSPTPHWLRHMAVAVLAAGGAAAHDVQRYLGHRELSTTMGTYGGMLGGLTGDVADRVDLILSGRGPAGPVVVGQVEVDPRQIS